MMRCIFFLGIFLLQGVFLSAGDAVENILSAVEDSDLTSGEKQIMRDLFPKIAQTSAGSFVLERAPAKLRFTVKPLQELGNASSDGMISLGEYRLDWMARSETAKERKIHECVLAEILVHELCHSIQFREGCHRIPASASFADAVALDMLNELTAKLYGEMEWEELSRTPEYSEDVRPKITVWHELLARRKFAGFKAGRAAELACADFIRVFWENKRFLENGDRLGDDSIREIRFWNEFYLKTAFRRHAARLASGISGGDVKSVFAKAAELFPPPRPEENYFTDPEKRSFRIDGQKAILLDNGKAVRTFDAAQKTPALPGR